MESYYPVNSERNNKLAKAYKESAKKEENVIFGAGLRNTSITIWHL